MNSHAVIVTKLQEQSSIELLNCIENLYKKNSTEILNCNLENLRNIKKELFKRIINPIYLISLILISLLILLISKENKNYFKFRFLIFILGIITLIVSESILGYVSKSFLNNMILAITPVTLILITYIFILTKLKKDMNKL